MSGQATCESRFEMSLLQPPAAVCPPRRRAVKQMRKAIEEHAPGAEWTVQFHSAIFGVYCISGPVHRSVVTGELRIGLAFITVAGRTPLKRTLGIWPRIENLTEGEYGDCDAAEVHHGVLVRAQFSSFGDVLTIVGHAVAQQRNDLIGVGHHVIRVTCGS